MIPQMCYKRRGKRKLPLGWGSFRGYIYLDMGISGIICSKRSFFRRGSPALWGCIGAGGIALAWLLSVLI